MTKPPAQTMAPSGFDALAPMGADPAPSLNLDKLCRLPPFQAYVESREPNLIGANADAYARERVMAAAERGELQAWLVDYQRWHYERVHWRGEDPFGGALDA